MYQTIVEPIQPQSPRNGEGSILPLRDGRLLLAYSHFTGGDGDDATAEIAGRYSKDCGRSWGERFILQPNDGKLNVMSASLLRLAANRIGLFYLKKDAQDDLNVFLRVSGDEGKSWDAPRRCTPDDGYHVMNNDRALCLSTNRILLPVAYSSEAWGAREHYTCRCYLSDDGGETWRAGKGSVDAPRRGAMEPGVVELRDGRLLMIIRTQVGQIYRAYSPDGGDTWTPGEAMGVAAPEAPATIKRIPDTGDLILFWNDSFMPGKDHGGRRTPLAVAVSQDEGRTWIHRRLLECDPTKQYHYLSACFPGGRVVLSYYEDTALKVTVVPIGWFYEPSGK